MAAMVVHPAYGRLSSHRVQDLRTEQPAAVSLPRAASFFGNAQPFTAVAQSCRSSAPPLSIVCKESRIGKAPITIPSGVSITLDGGRNLLVKGPLGQLTRVFPNEVVLSQTDGVITVARAVDTRRSREMHGLFRTLTSNMVVGVSQGFMKKLILIGVGYRAAVDKNDLVLNLGFFNPVRMAIPAGISVKVEENTRVTITGYDKVAVGDFAANVRAWRKPEPYKGKGIRYEGENVRRKEGKVGKKK